MNNNWIKSSMIGILVMSLLIGLSFPVHAEESEAVTEATVKAYVDSFVKDKMEKYHVPNASVAIVYEGKSLYTQAYGYEDVDNGILADEGLSMFGIGSATKTFIYTGAMQLVEQGLLDLDAPVSDYLDFELDVAYDTPIIVSDLMNHTAGFEEKNYNMCADRYENIQPLGEWLKKNQPKQVREPRTMPGYSNYGVSLLAYIIEIQSGTDINTYVEENILKPLSMAHTRIDQEPVPHTVKVYSYDPKNEIFKEEAPQYFNVGPSGAMILSAEDMAKFMIAQLNEGSYEGVSILQKETIDLMHETSFTMGEGLNGMAHGYMEGDYGIYDYIHHSGTTSYQFTGNYLFESLGLGIYITAGCGGETMRSELMEGFMDTFFKQDKASITFMDNVDVTPYEGTYYMSRSNYSGFEKTFTWFSNQKITVDGQWINVNGENYGMVKPLMFMTEDGYKRLYFYTDEAENVIGFNSAQSPITSYIKEEGLRRSGVQLQLLGVIVIVMVLTLAIRFILWLLHMRTRRKERSKYIRRSNIYIAFMLLGVGGLTLSIITLNQVAFLTGSALVIKLALVFTTLSIPVTLLAAKNLVDIWRFLEVPFIWKLYETFLFIAMVLMVGWYGYWHLVGWWVL